MNTNSDNIITGINTVFIMLVVFLIVFSLMLVLPKKDKKKGKAK